MTSIFSLPRSEEELHWLIIAGMKGTLTLSAECLAAFNVAHYAEGRQPLERGWNLWESCYLGNLPAKASSSSSQSWPSSPGSSGNGEAKDFKPLLTQTRTSFQALITDSCLINMIWCQAPEPAEEEVEQAKHGKKGNEKICFNMNRNIRMEDLTFLNSNRLYIEWLKLF